MMKKKAVFLHKMLYPNQVLSRDSKSSIIALTMYFPAIISKDNLDCFSNQWQDLASYKTESLQTV